MYDEMGIEDLAEAYFPGFVKYLRELIFGKRKRRVPVDKETTAFLAVFEQKIKYYIKNIDVKKL